MKIIKHHSLVLSLIIVLLGALFGLLFGWFYAGWRVEAIAEELRRANPNDPLDGLFFVSLGIIWRSFLIGTLSGIVIGTISYFFTGKTKNLI